VSISLGAAAEVRVTLEPAIDLNIFTIAPLVLSFRPFVGLLAEANAACASRFPALPLRSRLFYGADVTASLQHLRIDFLVGTVLCVGVCMCVCVCASVEISAWVAAAACGVCVCVHVSCVASVL
jgi:hypothetical protein